MTIHFLERNEIDINKWDAVVDADPSGMPYGFSWYLDIVCDDQWHGLILDDYQSVFPLPFNEKLWISQQVTQPILTQQLGIFGPDPSPPLSTFLHHIPGAFKKIVLQARQVEKVKGWQCKKRLNLVIDLKADYDSILLGYKKNLRKRIENASQVLNISDAGSADDLVALYKSQQGDRVGFSEENFQQAYKLISTALAKEQGKVLEVKDRDGTLLCLGFFLFTHKRIINLFSAATDEGRRQNARHCMIDYLLKKYAGSNMVFDFEGSEIPGVQKFFKSFGAKPAYYGVYERNTLPKFWKWALKTRQKLK